ncbi:MAG: hypothetical protein BME93_03195 [Methanosarcinales archaeon Met12]|nr:MAG: hypothetical protein BME93_03195 [Methanosarcinales archaeon Met12]
MDGTEVPEDILFDNLVEAFCKYTEDDFYEWLKDNYKSFFHSLSEGETDWNWIKERIRHYSKVVL